MKFYNKDFENRLKKRFVQRLLYSLSNVRTSNVLMLCGPALKDHIIDSRIITGRSPSKCYIYEKNEQMYRKNISDLEKLKTRDNIIIVNDDIVNAKIQRFVDFDACMSFDNLYPTIDTLYNKMNNTRKGYSKNLLITTSLRSSVVKNNKQYIINETCKLFNLPNNFKKSKISISKNSSLYFSKTKEKTLMYMTYRDKTPMISFSLQW